MDEVFVNAETDWGCGGVGERVWCGRGGVVVGGGSHGPWSSTLTGFPHMQEVRRKVGNRSSGLWCHLKTGAP